RHTRFSRDWSSDVCSSDLGNVYGDLFALMTILKGLPIGYNRDLQEDKRIVFRAYDTVSQCLTMAAAIVNSASFIKENIEPTLDQIGRASCRERGYSTGVGG